MAYNDVFKEQLVEKQKNSKDTMKKVGIGVAGVILIFIVTMLPLVQNFLLPIGAAIIWVMVILIRRYNIEYEYIFTNGELDVDKIMNRSKRKRAFSIDVRKFNVFVKADHADAPREISQSAKVLDFSSGTVNENTYYAVFEHEGKKTQMIIEPNETLFDSIKMYIPRKIKN